ncbi:MAG: MerR family transcriptional regulator [Mucinivorans sp.]
MAKKTSPQKQILYPMGQVCEMFDLPATTVRFWEKSFKILKPKKNAKGNRLFTPEDVENLKIIYHLLKERGMTIAGANQFMENRRVALRREVGIVDLLQAVRAQLVSIRQEIESTEHEVTEKSKKTLIIQDNPEAEAPQDEQEQKPRYIELSLFDQ